MVLNMHGKKNAHASYAFFQMLNIKILIKLMIIIFSTCCLSQRTLWFIFLFTYTIIWNFYKFLILFDLIIQIQNILHVTWWPKLHTMLSNICPYVINLSTIHKLWWFPYKVRFHWIMWKNGKIHQKSGLFHFVMYHVHENNIKSDRIYFQKNYEQFFLKNR